MMREDTHIFSGMKRDVHPSKQDSQMLWDCLNMRLTSRNETENAELDSNTMLSLTNESSTGKILSIEDKLNKILGINTSINYIGHCILGKYIVLFVNSINIIGLDKINIGAILRIDPSKDKNDVEYLVVLYAGRNLDFEKDHPIYAIPCYETEYIQKVYWVDGKRSPRIINVAKPTLESNRGKQLSSYEVRDSNGKLLGMNYSELYTDAPFNFVQELELNEKIEINRTFDKVGSFHSGVIQYAFTYYYKYGQESNIFYTSPLLYISNPDRGAKEDDIINCAFNIIINDYENKFDYIRVYSILRSTKDTTPSVRRVTDIEILDNTTISFIDTGTTGDSIDPQSLLFLGGQSIVAGCISSIENTLFLGDIKYDKSYIKESLLKGLKFNKIESSHDSFEIEDIDENSYHHINQLKENWASFKYGETYRLGIQLQYKDGSWSQPIPWRNFNSETKLYDNICDVEMKEAPCLEIDDQDTIFSKTEFIGDINLKTFAKDYKRVRPIIVIPEWKDRTILAQGFLCPTVFQLNNRLNSGPYAQSSWFLRPIVTNTSTNDYPEFRHLETLGSGSSYTTEIQNMCYNIRHSLGEDVPHRDPINAGFGVKESTYESCFSGDTLKRDKVEKYIVDIKGAYMVDQSILTFHSPDVEFNEDIQNIISNDNKNIKLRIIGTANFNLNISSADITLSSATAGSGGSLQPQLIRSGFKELVAGGYFQDAAIDDKGEKDEDGNPTNLTELSPSRNFNWLIYPWHRNGSLNNDIARPSGMGQRTSILKKKVLSNLKYAANNKYFNELWKIEDSYGDSLLVYVDRVNKVKVKETQDKFTKPITVDNAEFQVFNSNEVSLIKFRSKNSRSGTITYYGNVDTVNPTYNKYNAYVSGDSSDYSEGVDINGNSLSTIFSDNVFALSTLKWKNKIWYGDFKSNLSTYDDPIRIKYKSTPHVVVKLKDYQILGQVNNDNYSSKGVNETKLWMMPHNGNVSDYLSEYIFYREDNKIISKKYLGGFAVTPAYGVEKPTDDSYLFIAEIIQSIGDRYGGTSEEAFKNNLWIPAGPSVKIEEDKNTSIKWVTGDTWYQRYDCLKTYPFTQEDENQIVEIGSVMLETRFNLEGRYDRNRGLVDNTKVSPLNFNLMNPVYSQLDNFFNYRIMDEDYYLSNHYPNQIAWSLPKANGAVKDEWTSINLANTLNLDGSQGKVINIASHNDILLAFQESAIQQLIFNPRVQVQASDGVPIEIANSQKMQGTRVISDTIGCQDKFSMTSSPYGLYFIDNNNNSAYLFDGKINDIGANLGQLYWFRENYSNTTWRYEVDEDGINNSIRLAYDPKYKDVYFTPGIDKDKDPRPTLCYSELLGKFSGFFTYDGAVLIPTDNKLFSIHKEDGNLCLYEHIWSKGNTEIFGKKRPYSFSFISNQNGAIDKTFDTIELRASLYDIKNNSADIQGTDIAHNKQSGQPFNYIRVETETQDTGKQYFNDNSLRKKFNIWRGIVPRDIKSNNGRARIKNTWAKIELGNDRTDKGNSYKDESSDNSYTILHDITVKYSI